MNSSHLNFPSEKTWLSLREQLVRNSGIVNGWPRLVQHYISKQQPARNYRRLSGFLIMVIVYSFFSLLTGTRVHKEGRAIWSYAVLGQRLAARIALPCFRALLR